MYWRGVRVWRLSHGAQATSDLLCGAVRARRAGTTRIAEAVTPTVTIGVAAVNIAAAEAGAVATVVAIITVTAEPTIATTVTAVVAVGVAAVVAAASAAITNITAAKTAAAGALRKRRGRDAHRMRKERTGKAAARHTSWRRKNSRPAAADRVNHRLRP